MGFVDQLDQTVERIIDDAIDFYMYTRGWYRVGKGDYHYMSDADWAITPPGRPARTTGGQVTHAGLPKSWGFDYGSGTNAGSFVYGHFEQTIREVFYWWRSIPTPTDFDPFLDHLSDAAWYISLTSNGNTVTEIGNTALDSVKFLQAKIDGMSGEMINTFNENFCTPLPTVIHGQYAVTLLAGTTLGGEREIWDKAQKDILAIADKMHAAMKARGPADALDLGVIAALFNIAAVFPSPAKPVLAGAGTVLGQLNTLLKPGSQPTKPTVEFAAGEPEEVITKTKAALTKLAQTIRGLEDDLENDIKGAMDTVTDAKRSGSFDMPKPALLGETHADVMKVDLGDLNHLATKTLPNIEKQLHLASDNIFYSNLSSGAWYRPTDIGVSETAYGPYDSWSALASLAKNLTADLTWEVKQSGEHLAIAADQTGRTDAEIEASMKRHAEKLGGGSGYDPIGDASRWRQNNP